MISDEELVDLWSKTGDQDFNQVEQYGRAVIAECVRRLRENHDPRFTAMVPYNEAADWLESEMRQPIPILAWTGEHAEAFAKNALDNRKYPTWYECVCGTSFPLVGLTPACPTCGL